MKEVSFVAFKPSFKMFPLNVKPSLSIILLPYVLVAQWIERLPPKQQVARSSRAEDDSFNI